MIKIARKRNKTVIVDPKYKNFENYFGANIITPNIKELQNAVGSWNNESELEKLVFNLRKKYKIDLSQNYSEKNNIQLLSMPIHPFSRVSEQSVTQNKRYLDFLDRMQWPLRRLLIAGIHVHVGVNTGEMAIAVVNGMRRYIPYLILVHLIKQLKYILVLRMEKLQQRC